MRELLEKNRKITIVPADVKCANKGVITETDSKYFTIELEYEPKGIMRHNYCEFYTTTNHGTLFFNSFAETIDGKTLKIANPAKHKFLQRRQYRRIKFIHDLDLNFDGGSHKITTLDISAGGMKFNTNANVDIEKEYTITIPLSEKQSVECIFSPIRIEKREMGGYTLSGRFDYHNSTDKMTLTQFCAKRSIEIRNK